MTAEDKMRRALKTALLLAVALAALIAWALA